MFIRQTGQHRGDLREAPLEWSGYEFQISLRAIPHRWTAIPLCGLERMSQLTYVSQFGVLYISLLGSQYLFRTPLDSWAHCCACHGTPYVPRYQDEGPIRHPHPFGGGELAHLQHMSMRGVMTLWLRVAQPRIGCSGTYVKWDTWTDRPWPLNREGVDLGHSSWITTIPFDGLQEGYTPLLNVRKFASRISWLTHLYPSGPGVSKYWAANGIKVMRGQFATPPLWGGVGWRIVHNKERLGQEYIF